MRHTIDARRRRAIRSVARHHGVGAIRWWPPTLNPGWVHLVVEDRPDSLPTFRSDLEEAWGSLLVETVSV